MNNTFDIYYDEEGDFLEVSFGEPSKQGTTEEIEQGVFITRDVSTKDIRNVGILDFSARAQLLAKVLTKMKLRLPINISAQ